MSTSSKTIILVTGGNAGLGLATVRLLLDNPQNHVLVGSRSPEKGTAAVHDLQAANPSGTCEALPLDVTDEASIQKAAAQVEKSHGKLNVLVNNAGIAYNWDKAPDATHMARLYATNVIGPHLVTEAFMPLLLKTTPTSAGNSAASGPPRVVNISSGGGSINLRINPPPAIPHPTYRTTAYSCSKAGLNMLTADQAAWYREKGVKVFAVSPGYVVSGLGPHNKREFGAKPVEEGAAIVVEVAEGKRDAESGGNLHGHEEWHEKKGNGVYPW